MEPPSALSAEHALVAELLSNSVAADRRVREEAYARIVELESRPTFLATLIDVAYMSDAGVSKLAFICAKNALARIRGVSAARTTRGIAADDSDAALENLKSRLLSVLEAHLTEPGRLLCKDVALLVRKICRWNYPQSWMPMHELLVRGLEAALAEPAPSTPTLNCVLLLHHIFKEKCSMRLVRDRNATVQLAEALYPFVSKLWLQHWLHLWASGGLDAAQARSALSSTTLETSRYLDSLLIALYTHGLRDVYQRSELLDLLRLVYAKLKLHLSLVLTAPGEGSVVAKNCRRLLRGVSEMLDKEAMVFAFVDIALVLNPVFDYLASGSSEPVISQCMDVLCSAFKSPVLNNERYMAQFSAMHGDGGGARTSRKAGSEDFTIFATFSDMRAHSEMSASCAKNVTVVSALKASSSPTKGSYLSIGGVANYMSRQATFFFWECVLARGGLMALLEFLRRRFMTQSAEAIAEWSEEAVPMDAPAYAPAHALIGAMKLAGAPVLQWIMGGILGADCRADFFTLDSYLQIYTIAFPGIAGAHSCKHYLALLDAMKAALAAADPETAKLLIFRCSRIVGAWAERINLFEEQTKSELLRYLLYCLCCEGDSLTTVNLRVQHVVPFHRLYNKTVDEPFWDVLRRGTDVQRVASSLLAIAKIDVPTIQHRALELVCKMCLEFDSEENNFGEHLSDVLAFFSSGHNDLQVTASLLQTSLGFLNALDWERCYVEDSYLNAHLLRFLFHLLFRTVVVADASASYESPLSTQRMVSPCSYPELEEDVLTLWVCLLRVLPRNIAAVDSDLLNDVFRLFPLLLAYLTDSDGNRGHERLQAGCAPELAVDIVTEYVATVLDCTRAYMPDAAAAAGVAATPGGSLRENGGELWFQAPLGTSFTLAFSVSKVKTLCLESLKCANGSTLHQAGIRLLNMLVFGFGSACLEHRDALFALRELLLHFCGELNAAAVAPGDAPPELQRSRLSRLADGSSTDLGAVWQCSRVSGTVVDSISSLIPIICRWGLDAPASFTEALISVLDGGQFASPEKLLLSLLHASSHFKNNAYLRLGALICCCLMCGAVTNKYSGLRLFVQHHDVLSNPATAGSGHTTLSDNPHPNRSGVYLPCFMLRLVDSIVSQFAESKRAFCFSITKASLQKNGKDYTLPSSKRFHVFANASSTYQSAGFPMANVPAHELFYGG
ncbi:importin-11 [Babesia caballi]|uniref:Importin-11 n=1 Tax=Babesia caballi TaxID=5871 RepID=A0AAV4LVE9_BABCB|nr:importin-11 [Babesia caballi]